MIEPTTRSFREIVRGAATAEESAGKALDLILAETGTTSGTIHLLTAGGTALRLLAARGVPPSVLDTIRSIPIGKGMAGAAVASKRPVTTCDLQTDDARGIIRPGARATGAGGAVAVPILRGEDAIGALGVATSEPRDFRPDEIETLMELGRALAEAGWDDLS